MFTKVFAAMLALAVGSSHAHAGVLGFATNANSFVVTATEQPVPLRNDGVALVTFRTKVDNTFVTVTFNAECSAASDHVGDAVVVGIAVDNVMLTDPNFHFCSALVDTGQNVYTAASRRAVFRVPTAGVHTARVFTYLTPGTFSGHLDDSSIVIED